MLYTQGAYTPQEGPQRIQRGTTALRDETRMTRNRDIRNGPVEEAGGRGEAAQGGILLRLAIMNG